MFQAKSIFAADSRQRTILYWMVTLLVVAESLLGGIWDIWRIPYVYTEIVHLGYPPYVLTLLGIGKLLGAVAILMPRFPRLKEWAYAGMFFNYVWAVASHFIVGDGFDTVAYPIIVAILVLLSWAFRPASRRNLIPGRDR